MASDLTASAPRQLALPGVALEARRADLCARCLYAADARQTTVLVPVVERGPSYCAPCAAHNATHRTCMHCATEFACTPAEAAAARRSGARWWFCDVCRAAIRARGGSGA